MAVEELIGDVGEDGSSTRGDAPLGDENQEASEELVDVRGALELRELAEEFGREINRVTLRLLTGGAEGGAEGEGAQAKTKLGIQAGMLDACGNDFYELTEKGIGGGGVASLTYLR